MLILTNLHVDSGYAATVLPAELLLGLGLGLVMMPAMSTATSGVEPRDAGVTSATVNTAQQVGGSIGTALLNTIAASAAGTYIATHAHTQIEVAKGTVHGYTVAIWWAVGVLVLAAIVAGVLISTSPRRKAKAVEKHVPAKEAQTVPEAGSPPDVAPEPGTAVRGTVTGTRGAPVPDAALTLIDSAGRQVAQAAADGGGRYRLAVATAGQYVLVTSAPAHQPEAAPVTVSGAPQELDVVLAGAYTLSGTVRDHAGDLDEGALAVLADSRGEVVGTCTSGEDGAYRFASLAPGGYTLAVSHPAHQPVAKAVTVADGSPATLDVALGANAALSGTVTARAGGQVGHVRVTLVDGTGEQVASTLAGADGSYRFDGLRPGDYTVVASGYAPAAHDLVVDPSAHHRHDVDLAMP
jgi:protocatechuate 3,4-dioxygenase beta subunit